MGWFDGWFGSNSSSTDPFRKVDPQLREFLERETPSRGAAASPPQPQPAPAPTPAAARPQDDVSKEAVAESEAAKVPAESLFQDGRYAHLWKTYSSQHNVEAATKPAQEKIEDMLEMYKERKYNIGKTAMENCAIEQQEWVNCFSEGGWGDKLQMCRHQLRKFERCYTVQGRLLRALGYGSTLDMPDDLLEDIQMHADALYHRMLAQEKAIKEAEAAGLPLPVFDPVVPRQKAAVAPLKPTPVSEDKFLPPEDVVAGWQAALDKLSPEERATEEAALRADYRAKAQMAAGVSRVWDEERKERLARKAEGKPSWQDVVAGAVWGDGSKGSKETPKETARGSK